jgi:hypothetical protein
MSWLLGFSISGTIWLVLNTIWPPKGLGEIDEKDIFGTFNATPQLRSGSELYGSSSAYEEDIKEENQNDQIA